MKKLLILAALIAALCAGSCDFLFEYDITVENDTYYEIEVALSQSTSRPGSGDFESIDSWEKAVFTVTMGDYYVHMRPVGGDSGHFPDSIDVGSDATWTITYNSGEEKFILTYPR